MHIGGSLPHTVGDCNAGYFIVAQVDGSGNGPIRRMVVRAVSLHPDPLPQGEGTARSAQWRADGSGLFSAQRKVHPLPKGEGWGEGKETTAPRRADVLTLACLQYPTAPRTVRGGEKRRQCPRRFESC